jgi:hypothetical protein
VPGRASLLPSPHARRAVYRSSAASHRPSNSSASAIGPHGCPRVGGGTPHPLEVLLALQRPLLADEEHLVGVRDAAHGRQRPEGTRRLQRRR